jgi:hypothetical protein
MTKNKKANLAWSYLVALLLVALIIGLLVACGDSYTNQVISDNSTQTTASKTAPAGNGPKVDPCNLISNEDLAAILGGPVTTRENTARGPFVMCNYNVSNNTFATKSFLVSVNIEYSSKSIFKREVDTAAKFLDSKAEPMAGVGEDAYNLGETFYYVLKNKVSFNLFFPYGDKEPGTAEKAKAIALKMVERL